MKHEVKTNLKCISSNLLFSISSNIKTLFTCFHSFVIYRAKFVLHSVSYLLVKLVLNLIL